MTETVKTNGDGLALAREVVFSPVADGAVVEQTVRRLGEAIGLGLIEVGERLPRSLAARAGNARADLNLVAGRLRRDLVDQRIAWLTERLRAAWKMAELVHPERPLSKGYVRVTSRDGHTLIHARDAREAGRLTLHFSDGKVDAAVDGNGASRAIERKRPRPYIPPQPGLFDPEED